jgi:hypothetical protein
MISFAIPNYNRVDTVMKLVNEHATTDAVSEIVICDDASRKEVVDALLSKTQHIPKVRVVQNDTNYGLFFNKLRTVENCNNAWIVLCDSDNFMGKDYIQTLLRESPWEESTVYCPDKVGPFDFTPIGGEVMSTLQEVNTVLSKIESIRDVFLNTGNYFFNKYKYQDVCQRFHTLGLDPHKLWAAEVHALNYAWIALGGKIKCVRGLSYFHDTTNADSSWRRITATKEGREGSANIRNEINKRLKLGR